MKKSERKKFLWVNITAFSAFTLTPHFSNTMLYAVLFIQIVWKYAGEQRKIYSFFAEGKRGKGKALLQMWVLVWVERTANVLFPLRWTLFLVLCRRKEEIKWLIGVLWLRSWVL